MEYIAKNSNISFLKDTVPFRVVCISDTHQRHSWISDVIQNDDLLIHCGDIMFQDTLSTFNEWIGRFEDIAAK